MTTALDTSLRQAAENILAQFGRSTTFTVKSGGTWDNSASAYTGVTTTNYTVTASPPLAYKSGKRDQPGSEKTDQLQQVTAVVYVAATHAEAQSFTPTVDMLLTIGSKEYRVVEFDTYYSGDLIAAYKIYLAG